MQILSYRPGMLRLPARIFLVFVTISSIVFVNVQYVYAADTYNALYYVNYQCATSDNPYKFTANPDRYVTDRVSGSNSGIYDVDGLAIYDIAIPLSLHFQTLPRQGAYTLSSWSNGRLNFTFDQNAYLLSCYVDSPHCSISYSLLDGDSGAFVPGQHKEILFNFRFFDLPCIDYDSANVYIHLLVARSIITPLDTSYPINISVVSYYGANISDSAISKDTVVGSIESVEDTLDKQREEDRDSAEKGGEDATVLVENLDGTIKSKWEILWYPLEFTQRVASVFGAGTSSASYKAIYADVVDYRYDELSGYLVPVRDRVRAQARAGGTIISFPAFSIMGMQVWDAYDFDLAQLKTWFPELFNLLYVAISILEVYWFVSFLRNKYDEVFG